MRILFVCRGNKSDRASPMVKSQGDSLVRVGIELSYFFIKGKGWRGYIKSLFRLREHLHGNAYDLIHAHYSLSAYVASLACRMPIVVSLMGSDVLKSKLGRF